YTYGWCAFGSNQSLDCPKGVCMHAVQNSYLHPTLLRMLDVASARTGNSKVKVILVGNGDPIVNPPNMCVGGTNRGSPPDASGNCPAGLTNSHSVCACTLDAQCPSGKCLPTMTSWSWRQGLDATRAWSRWLKALAAERTIPYVDANSYLHRLNVN